MKLIFRYLKPFALLVAVCLALLCFQAVCDLSLPDMMSDIVNVGIQQSGIPDGAPELMSPDAMDLVTGLLPGGDGAEFRSAYAEISGGSTEAKSYLKHYPQTGSGTFFALKEASAAADALFARAAHTMVSLSGAFGGDISAAEGETAFSGVTAETLYFVLPRLLGALPDGALLNYMEAAKEAGETARYGVILTRLFYEELGADISAIQKAYILNTGFRMLGMTFLVTAASLLVGFFASRIAASLSRNLRRDIFSRVMHFSNSEIDKFSTASLITRTTNDVTQVQMLVIIGLRMLCLAPVMGIGGIVMALRSSVSLSWIIALGVLVVVGLIVVVFSVAMPKFRLQQKLLDRLNLVSRENLSGLMVIRAFGNEAHEEKRFEEVNRDVSETNRFVQRVMAMMFPTMSLVMNLLTVTIVWVGSNAIAASTLQIGDMLAFTQYAMQIIMSFLMISMMFIMIPRASVSATRIREVLDTPFNVKDPVNPKQLSGRGDGSVRFQNVSFRYDNAEMDALQGISFTAKPGTTTAFIGATGSGKTTLINLIPRFYDVTDGSVEVGGVDVREITQQELRAGIGYISQKGILFSGDIASNVRYGSENADVRAVWDALKTAQAEDFSKERGGLESAISQGGSNVSGGQKQRLSIARALVKKAPVYIFDDTFSALDFKTDAKLRQALKEYTGGATVLIVAQRISTVMNADQIIVLDRGHIVGNGTHKELLQTCATYREIAESQLSEEELI